jgi:hypothetical protein
MALVPFDDITRMEDMLSYARAEYNEALKAGCKQAIPTYAEAVFAAETNQDKAALPIEAAYIDQVKGLIVKARDKWKSAGCKKQITPSSGASYVSTEPAVDPGYTFDPEVITLQKPIKAGFSLGMALIAAAIGLYFYTKSKG